jgi:hypothetical protein
VLSSPPFIAATAVRIDPSDSSKIYASAFNGVFETGDGGATWELSSLLGASAHAIAIDPSDGSRLVAGLSQPSDAFVTRLSADGSALVYSTYFGSTGPDEAFGVALDAAGDTYVTGATASATLATAGAFQPQHGGVYDGFVAKLVTGVAISGADLRAKRLVVSGDGFARGATVLVDGVALRTRADRRSPSTTLVVPNAVRAIAPGQTVTLAVRNRDGSVSPEYRFTRQ